MLVSLVVWFGLRGTLAMLMAGRNHPEVREKIKRVITQGHIDPEDFKGVSTPVLAYTHRDALLMFDGTGPCVEQARTEGHSSAEEEGCRAGAGG